MATTTYRSPAANDDIRHTDITQFIDTDRGVVDAGEVKTWTGITDATNPILTIRNRHASGPIIKLQNAATGATMVQLNQSGWSGTHALKMVDVKMYGAVGDGSTNDTTAVQAALTAAKALLAATGSSTFGVFFPAGTYLVTDGLTLSSAVGIHLYGEGMTASILKKTSSGNLLTMTSCNFGLIENLGFSGTTGMGTTLTTANGVVLTGSGSGNVIFRNCRFDSFPGRGLWFNFGSGDASGHIVDTCIFQDNTITARTGGAASTEPGQLDGTYMADFRILNNQFGVNAATLAAQTGASNSPYYGVKLTNSMQGMFKGNMAWNNLVGFRGVTVDCSNFSGNRIEHNLKNGAEFDASTAIAVVDNTFHTNGQLTNATYTSLAFTGIVQGSAIGNKFQFTGNSPAGFATNKPLYHFSTDANCTTITEALNQYVASSYTSAATNHNAAALPLWKSGNTDGAVKAGLITAMSTTATAAGSAGTIGLAMGTAGVGFAWGTGAPSFTAPKGTIYTNTTATTTTTRVYVNTDGGTTWANFTASA